DRLLVGLVGVEVLLGRLLVVELGQPEHRVRRPALVVRGLEQKGREHRDGVASAVLGLLIVEIDLLVVLGVDLFDLLLVGALEDRPRRAPVLGDHVGEVLDVLRHVVEQPRIDGGGRRSGRRSGGARRARIDGDARQQTARQRQGQGARNHLTSTARAPPHLSSSSTLRKSSSSALSSRFLRLVSLVTAWVFSSLRPQETSMMPTSERTTRS